VNAAADLIQTIWMKHWDWSAKGVVKCLGAQNESRRVERNIPTGNKLKEAFVSGVTSNQALFSEYLARSDKLWLIGEDGVLNNWSNDAAGKQVTRQVLALYDCPPWRESYLKHKKGDGGAIQEVPETSTSILIGATPEGAPVSASWRRARGCARGSVTTRASVLDG
jgi:hypothetical protein